MSVKHKLTRNIGNLKGFSTDSSFLRPANVAQIAQNMMRYPDGTLAVRRGYQCQIGTIGGLGTGTYHGTTSDTVETVTINDDGLLYKKLNKQIYLNYDGRVMGGISGATNANPAQITTSLPHNLVSGTIITISGVLGMVQLNGNTYTITVTGANTFTLNGINSTAYGVYISGGQWIVTFTAKKYLNFTIFTDPRFLDNSLGWSLAQWSIVPWAAPGFESITCQILNYNAAEVSGNQVNVNTITVQFIPGVVNGSIVQFLNSAGVLQQRGVTAFTLNTITVDGLPVSVSDGTAINQFFDILFDTGFQLVGAPTIQDFINIITSVVPTIGVLGLKVAVNGDTNLPAAFIEIIEPVIINSGTIYDIQYFYWEQVNKTVPVLFPGSIDPKFLNSDDFENASFATFDDVIYMANGVDFPKKYDDQTAYLTGMPVGVHARPVFNAMVATALSDGTYNYASTYEQVDNIGHIVEGAISGKTQIVLDAGPSTVNVNVTNIAAGSGYNTNGAIATGGIATAYGPDINGFYYDFIAVTAGQTLNVGDTAYYQDTVVATKNLTSGVPRDRFQVNAGHGVEIGDIVTFLNSTGFTQVRLVVATDATHLTVEGTPVIVTNLSNFSANKANKVFGNVAIITSTQVNVNIILVNAGYTIQIGDVVEFTDSTGRLQRRNVTNIGAGSITIDGIPVSVTIGFLISSTETRTDAINVQRKNTTPPTLGAGAPISNNLRINIWRTGQNATLLQLLTTIPNNSFAPTQTFVDTIRSGQKSAAIVGATQANPCLIASFSHGLSTGNQISIINVLGMVQLNGRNYTVIVVDEDTFTLNGIDSTGYTAYIGGGTWSLIFSDNSQLGIFFPDPVRLPNPPPVSKYLLSFGNQLLYAGGKRGEAENDDNVFFSEGNLPESVPAATNFFSTPSPDDQITGLGASGTTLIVTKNRSLYAISGDLLTSQFQVTPIAPGTNIGCIANATIQTVGSLLYFLHTNGVYAITENQLYPTDPFGNPIAISSMIELIFRQTNYIPSTRYVLKRAVAANYNKDNQYLLFLPCENSNTDQRIANSNSILLCYDYEAKNWFLWNNINAAGGVFTVKDDLYFHARAAGVVGNKANLYKQHRFYRLVDHADHAGVQNVEWRSSWEDLGSPEVRKKFTHCMLLIDRISDLQQFNNPQMNFSSYVDRIEGLQSTIATINTVNNNNNAGWNNSPWVFNIWSGYQDSFSRINLKAGTVSKSMQVGFTMSTINTDFRFAGYQLECVPENRQTFVR